MKRKEINRDDVRRNAMRYSLIEFVVKVHRLSSYIIFTALIIRIVVYISISEYQSHEISVPLENIQVGQLCSLHFHFITESVVLG